MLNEDLEIDDSVTSSMSREAQKEIVNWIKRIEKNDSSLICIPQRGITDEEILEIELLEFIENNNIDLETAKIQLAESEMPISVSLDLENIKISQKKWWQF
ncbi:hypothetical protein [Bernardetia sp.]|uniref:hypothetical protein n=1 Tax=Bernardetia sp. TaxID=1937974 RepID=UPI0025BDDA29|nr:hypothetical protein [Bernardetia sp.]